MTGQERDYDEVLSRVLHSTTDHIEPVGDGFGDPGDGAGELLPGGVDAGEDCGDTGPTPALPLGVLLGLVCVALGWGVDTEPGGAWLPEPLVMPRSPPWLAGPVLGALEFA